MTLIELIALFDWCNRAKDEACEKSSLTQEMYGKCIGLYSDFPTIKKTAPYIFNVEVLSLARIVQRGIKIKYTQNIFIVTHTL